MDYNTQREKMKISDYGRNVYKLIQYCKTIEDREKRTRAAEVIVNVMSQVNPSAKDTDDYRRKLWDHLMIMSNWELDVDCPYELTRDESVEFHPRRLDYQHNSARYRHYGRCMESLIEKVSEMEEGDDKNLLSALLIQHMKKSYLTWNRSIQDGRYGENDYDDIIETQLLEISKGKLKMSEIPLPEEFERAVRAEMQTAFNQKKNLGKKKNKKKKRN